MQWEFWQQPLASHGLTVTESSARVYNSHFETTRVVASSVAQLFGRDSNQAKDGEPDGHRLLAHFEPLGQVLDLLVEEGTSAELSDVSSDYSRRHQEGCGELIGLDLSWVYAG